MKYTISIFSLILASFILAFKSANDIKPARILHQMYDSIKTIKTLKEKVKAMERVESKFVTASSEIKVQTHPRKVYFNNRDKKVEVLFDGEISAHKALVKVHTFPYLTLTLDPSGNIMRKNQHYSLNELGFEFIGKSIALTISKDKEGGLANFSYLGKVMKNGYNCYLLEYENKNYAYTNYTVGEKETASIISLKLCVNDYLLRYKNDLLNDFGFLKKGTVLKVPTLYCKKAILYIDDRLMLPVALSLYDDIGLFENYEYTNIEINKGFKPDEFSKDFKDYGF
ncbi:hypothetical protein CNR22_06635 [Sphingobacteriaceae bacterium]|nr:hypothetical protein CNR22_06635 [Sphingobacteriaceae bacterium]